MKLFINKILTGVIIMIMLGSCQDDILDEKPRNFLNPELSYGTDAGLVAGATGLYDQIAYPYFGSTSMRNFWTVINGATDYTQLGLQRDNEPFNTLSSELTPAIADGAMSYAWPHYYRIANNATTVIEYSKTHEWDNEQLKAQAEGEAYFFRGFAHFHLTMLWGDVAMIDEIISGVKIDFANSPKAENLQFIISDFQQAVNFLPDVPTQSGRVFKATANHMLAYAYLAAEEYQNAENAAQAAIDDPNTGLVTSRFGSKQDQPDGNAFWDLFQLGNQNINSEGLLVLQNGNSELFPQYASSLGGNNFRGPRALIPRYERANGLFSSVQYGGRGFGRFSPTMAWYSLFEAGDVRGEYPNLQSVWVANENSGTITAGDTLYVLGDESKSIYPQDDIRLRPFPTKYNKEYDPADPTRSTPHPNEAGYTGSTIRDQYMIRLAETYLILAEAQLMQGNTIDAAENINIVRRRSNASDIAPGDVTIDFILDEKARELWGEMRSRKIELFRTGKYVERVQANNPEAGANVSQKHSILPIPQFELDLNSQGTLTQNPGWTE